MQDFRHNLTPVEVKNFLRIAGELTENLDLRYVHKLSSPCPCCGQHQICLGAGVSLYSSNSKLTHEITVCLHCGYRDLATILTCERL